MKKIKIALAILALGSSTALASSPAYAACGIWGWLNYCKTTSFE